jgi:hypothetical protein
MDDERKPHRAVERDRAIEVRHRKRDLIQVHESFSQRPGEAEESAASAQHFA